METQYSKDALVVANSVEKICRNVRNKEKEIHRDIRKEVSEYKASLSGNPVLIRELGKQKHRELMAEINKRKQNIINAQCTEYQISVPYIKKILTKPEK